MSHVLVPVRKGVSLHIFCPRVCLLSKQYWIPEPDLFLPLAFHYIIYQTSFLCQERSGCLFVSLPHTDPEMLLIPTDHLILFTSSPLIYLVSKDEGRIGASCQSKSMLPPKGRDAGHAFCFFLPGCELKQLPWLHPSCCWAGGGSKHPRAGG